MDLDEDLAGGDFGDRDSFEADVVDAAIDSGQHGGRDFLRPLLRGQVLRDCHQDLSPVVPGTLLPGTIVLVRALSRSQAQRFSEAILVLRARRKARSHVHGRTEMWRTKPVVSNLPLRMKRDIPGISKLTSSEMALTARNGRLCFCAARATAAASMSTAWAP